MALLLRRPLLLRLARLNICGMRARLRELGVLPSAGWIAWYCSNSVRSALRALRKSVGEFALRSMMAGREKPRRRYCVARRAWLREVKDGRP